MREAEEKFTFINSKFPIRVGCKVEYVDKSTNNIIVEEVLYDDKMEFLSWKEVLENI